MDPTAEITQLLKEIRDTEREHLAEYRRMAQRSVEIQEAAVARQVRFTSLYRGVLVLVIVVVLGLIGVLVHLLGRLR